MKSNFFFNSPELSDTKTQVFMCCPSAFTIITDMLSEGTIGYWPFPATTDNPGEVVQMTYGEAAGRYNINHTAKNPSVNKAWCRYTTDVISTFLSLG